MRIRWWAGLLAFFAPLCADNRRLDSLEPSPGRRLYLPCNGSTGSGMSGWA